MGLGPGGAQGRTPSTGLGSGGMGLDPGVEQGWTPGTGLGFPPGPVLRQGGWVCCPLRPHPLSISSEQPFS